MRVMPENITPLWDQLAPLIEVELRTIPTHDVEDIRKLLLSGNAQLWIQWSECVEAMVITEFVSYPRGLALRAWMGAVAPGYTMNRRGLFKIVTQFARRHRCRWIDACGRYGWLRAFPEAECTGMFMRIVVGGDL